MLHSRATRNEIRKLKQQDIQLGRGCPFCDLSQIEEIIEETSTMRIIRQRTSYDTFEGIPVSDHLMITPKRHHATISTFNKTEKEEYMTLAGKYENGAYSLYSRGMKSATRSVEHVHTHLMKLEGHRVRAFLFIDRPYLVLTGRQRTKKTH